MCHASFESLVRPDNFVGLHCDHLCLVSAGGDCEKFFAEGSEKLVFDYITRVNKSRKI